METKNANQKTEVNFNEKQLEIFSNIINQSWASIAFSIKGTLNLMALTYIRSERIEGDSEEIRYDIAFHLEVLQNLIDDLRHYELKLPNLDDKKLLFDNNISGLGSIWNYDTDFTYSVKNSLSCISLEFIRSAEVTGKPLEDREAISFHIHLLNDLISNIYDLIMIAEEMKTVDSVINIGNEAQAPSGHCKECFRKEGIIEALEEELIAKEKRIEDLIVGKIIVSDECKIVPLDDSH